MSRYGAPTLVLVGLLVTAIWVHAQPKWDEVEIGTVRVADNLYMLTGLGGNLGLWTGGERTLLIDDQYAPLNAKIVAAIAKVTDRPVSFVLNTHWHSDHTGGNEQLGGGGAVILAHDNVRARLSTRQDMKALGRVVEPSPELARPVITYDDGVTFHLGDTIEVRHLPAAHTDGDSIVRFVGANVIHAGDVVFNGMYPFIDVDSGGSIDGVIDAVDRILRMCDPSTKIIPGHGELATPADLRDYRAMLVEARILIRRLIAQGKSRAQVVAAKPTAALDAKWGQGFMKPDKWTGIVYDSLTR